MRVSLLTAHASACTFLAIIHCSVDEYSAPVSGSVNAHGHLHDAVEAMHGVMEGLVRRVFAETNLPICMTRAATFVLLSD